MPREGLRRRILHREDPDAVSVHVEMITMAFDRRVGGEEVEMRVVLEVDVDLVRREVEESAKEAKGGVLVEQGRRGDVGELDGERVGPLLQLGSCRRRSARPCRPRGVVAERRRRSAAASEPADVAPVAALLRCVQPS